MSIIFLSQISSMLESTTWYICFVSSVIHCPRKSKKAHIFLANSEFCIFVLFPRVYASLIYLKVFRFWLNQSQRSTCTTILRHSSKHISKIVTPRIDQPHIKAHGTTAACFCFVQVLQLRSESLSLNIKDDCRQLWSCRAAILVINWSALIQVNVGHQLLSAISTWLWLAVV